MVPQGLMAKGVPPQPLWLLYIKIAILALSLIILALAAWHLSLFGGYAYYGSGAGGMDIFVAILSFIVYGGAAAVEIWAPQYFYCIGFFIGYILSIIFWLSAWAWSASSASAWLGLGSIYGYGNYGASIAACAGLGAVVWVLTIVHFFFFTRACLENSTDSGPGSGPGQAELGQVKHEAPPAEYQQPSQPELQPQQPQQPQQPYPPQPYPPQQYPVQQPSPYPTQ
ncbi:hypothetical protein BT67DRAFT_449617 [Trichocladium antarcticum]|uniref:MARVEL domain-containing protein n=1 Tax=Trichocladium antarcticum TaxID=1450529 RepID=A0AAN6UL38_9PEZI|nr:hypothetical protein BT67DRAFT_449617 [Trichocladium antarcticum]